MTLPGELRGPFPIVNRGHSGGRLLCEAFIRNGIDMGQVHPERKDTGFWGVWNEPGRSILKAAFRYQDIANSRLLPKDGKAEQEQLQELMRQSVAKFCAAEIQRPGPFGWKLGSMAFAAPLLLDALPRARVVHLLRDGRDIMLSRLGSRFHRLEDPLQRRMLLGPGVEDFRGHPLNAKTIERFRNALEMSHWVISVRRALACRCHADRYLEIRYEELCAEPLPVFARICDFLQLPLRPEAGRWLCENAHTKRIGKWRALSADELRLPLEIGGGLLRELGYLA